MKKVLIAIDYNPVSETVAEKGYDLAKTIGGEICLLHVLNDAGFYQTQFPTFMGYDGYSGIGPDFNAAMEMRKIAEDFLQKAATHLKDPNIKTVLKEGDSDREILSFAEEWGADIIVMGTHSHSVLEKLLMGTVAEKIIEKTKVPVYLVPVKK